MGVRFGAVALIAATMLAGGCAQLQQVGDRTSICVDALQAAGFTPDMSDPRQSAEEARQAADKLNDLAGQTPDQALKQALSDMAGTMGDFDPKDASGWVAQKGEQLDALRKACS